MERIERVGRGRRRRGSRYNPAGQPESAIYPAVKKKPEASPQITNAMLGVALTNLSLSPGDTFLDIGTGNGKIAIYAAKICDTVIGLDIHRPGLDIAEEYCRRHNITNTVFDYGSLEEPCINVDLKKHHINKILILRSMHHLPDHLKWSSMRKLVRLLNVPGKIVVADLMFFEQADLFKKQWEAVGYDGGLTDQPSSADFISDCLIDLGGKVKVQKLHPLIGVVTASFGG